MKKWSILLPDSFGRCCSACSYVLLLWLATGYSNAQDSGARPGRTQTVLGIQGSRFTLNGRPVFLLGISYYGALGAPEEFIRRDLDDVQAHGFNWLRVWPTWAPFDKDVSAVDTHGQAREPYLGKLK